MHVRVGRRGFGPCSPRLTNRWISSIFRGGGVARLPWKPGPGPGRPRARGPTWQPATGAMGPPLPTRGRANISPNPIPVTNFLSRISFIHVSIMSVPPSPCACVRANTCSRGSARGCVSALPRLRQSGTPSANLDRGRRVPTPPGTEMQITFN